ncbi:MAG: hypothetical protein D6690_17115 [Nitrospirae bacterium]|nr:MAG: hypothetical protein D6690_17115 [Nitrospirota bacterium]
MTSGRIPYNGYSTDDCRSKSIEIADTWSAIECAPACVAYRSYNRQLGRAEGDQTNIEAPTAPVVGMSDHTAIQSRYLLDPDGDDVQVIWILPASIGRAIQRFSCPR